jgi:restriction modification system DNA specificity domain protein
LNSAFGQGQKSFGKAKLKVVHISGTEIGNVVIPVPPLEEQKKIGLFLKEKCNEIDKLIENKEKIIEELEQYKKSVIYEYVTGKKEVK